MEKKYKHILVTYNKFVNSYKEYTAIIVDSNNNIVDSIDLLFDKGEYSKESIDKMSKYSILKDFYYGEGLPEWCELGHGIKRCNTRPSAQEQLRQRKPCAFTPSPRFTPKLKPLAIEDNGDNEVDDGSDR